MKILSNKRIMIIFGSILLSLVLSVTMITSCAMRPKDSGGDYGNDGGFESGGGSGGSGGGGGIGGGNDIAGDNGSGGNDKPSNDDIKRFSKFGVGYGSSWRGKVFVPYVDISDYSENKEYTYNGVMNLKKIYSETGITHYNLGFIENSRIPSTQKYQYVDGKQLISWSFGGYNSLSEFSSDKWQYSGIKQSIKDIRSVGGDVAISVGGFEGVGFFGMAHDSLVFENTYKHIIEGFGLTRIDLDIEESAQYYNHSYSAKALKKIQSEMPLEVVLTLPVSEYGFDNVTKQVIKEYIKNGVNISIINIMTMCYGGSKVNYGEISVVAIDNAMKDLQVLYREIGINLTSTQAYNKLGFTTAIGYTANFPIFTTSMTAQTVLHAKNKNLSLASYWSLNRDSKVWSNRGIYSKYEHTNLYKNLYFM